MNALLWAVEFQPEGLYFLRTALLTITFPAGVPSGAVSFAYGSKGRDCHLSPAFQQGGQVLVPIQHFSGTGQGSGTQEQIDHYYSKLTDGGKPVQCGWLVDRFGVSWQIIPKILGELIGDSDPEKAGRAMQAMLGMQKLDIAELKRAHAGK